MGQIFAALCLVCFGAGLGLVWLSGKGERRRRRHRLPLAVGCLALCGLALFAAGQIGRAMSAGHMVFYNMQERVIFPPFDHLWQVLYFGAAMLAVYLLPLGAFLLVIEWHERRQRRKK